MAPGYACGEPVRAAKRADPSGSGLSCPPFSTTAHAAGRYSADDAKPGCWDSIIVAGHRGTLEKGLDRLEAKILLLPAENDHILPPALAGDIHARIEASGGSAELAEIPGANGHLNGRWGIEAVGERIAAFLAE